MQYMIVSQDGRITLNLSMLWWN